MVSFLEILRDSDLEQFYPSFISNGINSLDNLSKLTHQDFTVLGVTTSSDRKSLYSLIQKIKSGTYSKSSSQNASRISHSASISRGRATSSKATFNNSKPPRVSDLASKPLPRVSDIPTTNKTGRKSLNLDAYGVPVKTASESSPLQCRLSKDLAEKIRVCVRKRPLSTREKNKGEYDIVDVTGKQTMILNEPRLKVDMTKYMDSHKFIFDEVIDYQADNQAVYERTAKPLIQHVFRGGNATCFAYGQTGSGKTYTMLDELSGLYVLTARDMFAMIANPEYKHLHIWISFFEIYQGNIIDLLNRRKKLAALQDSKQRIVIKDLREVPIKSVDNLIEVFDYGSSARSTGTTEANADSSRSHAIMQFSLKHRDTPKKIHGKFCFIDLAGSERGADRGEASAKTRLEGAEINKSLLALKECIRALDQDKSHLPFRQSKLTQVLKESFVGESRTCMIATISPNISNSEHTLNTLRYADRVKELRGETVQDEPVLVDEPMEAELDTELEVEEEEEEIEEQYVEEIRENNIESFDEMPLLQPSSQAIIDIPTRLNFSNESDKDLTPRSSAPRYSSHTIETIARNHRSQILLNTELCRSETKLLSDLNNISSDPQARKEVFENYLLELDELLERKLVCIEELKEQLAIVMSRANRQYI